MDTLTRTEHDTLPAGPWLAARLLVLFPLLAQNRAMVRPFVGIPAFPFADGLRQVPTPVWWPVTVLFLVAAAALWLGVRPRLAAGLAGGVILLDVAVNLAEYSTNRLAVGLVLVMIGLYDERLGLWPLRLQLALVYGGAALNKALDPAWRDGAYIENWTADILDLRMYGAVRDAWGGADTAVGWAVIVVETALATLVLRPAATRWFIGLALTFHLGMLVFTEGDISWVYAYAIGATLVAFTVPRRVAPYLAAAAVFWVIESVVS